MAFRRSDNLIVFDDSSPANQQKYFELLEHTRTHNDLFYVGPQEKEQFLAYLNGRLHDARLEGLVRNLFRPYRERSEGYLAFLGRMSPKKGVVRAIDIARRCGVPLKIAAKIYPEEQRYFDQAIAPLLDTSRPLVDYVGEVGGREKEQLLAGARALLFPIDWPEPFGLVMIESMACGTPVIGWRRGSVPEVLEDGVTGFIVDTVEEAVRAVGRIDEIDRGRCRRVFEERFDAGRMARDYLDVYARVARAVR